VKALRLTVLLALTVGPASAEWQAGSTQPVVINGTSWATCASANPDDCTKSDLVIETKDLKFVLIRGLYGCKGVASKIAAAEQDVLHAECFR